MSLADRLRIVRGSMGQTEFAKKIGSSQSGISAYEKGQRKPDYETLIRVSTEFGVTLDWLLLGKGPMHPAPHADEFVTGKMGATAPIWGQGKKQHVDFIDSQKDISGATAPIWEMQRELIRVTQENSNLFRQNGDLRVENERLRMDLERRDMRIRDLEREVAELREARKGPSAYGAGVAGSAG